MSGQKPTVGELNQKVEDHLGDCVRTREAIFDRLGKIDALLQKVGFMVVTLLITGVLGLAAELYRAKTAQLDNQAAASVAAKILAK